MFSAIFIIHLETHVICLKWEWVVKIHWNKQLRSTKGMGGDCKGRSPLYVTYLYILKYEVIVLYFTEAKVPKPVHCQV